MTMLSDAFRLHRDGRHDDAEHLCRRVLIAEPGQADASHLLGLIAHRRGRHADAVHLIGRVIALAGPVAHLHCNLGLALQDLGRLDDAVAAYQTAIRLRPDMAETHFNLGIAQGQRGRSDDAVAAYKRTISLNPELGEAYYLLGDAWLSQGRPGDALAAHTATIRLRPDLAAAHNNRGIAFYRSGRMVDAAAAHRAAIRLQPDFAEAYCNLGNVLNGLNLRQDAIAAFRAALHVRPDLAEAYHNLGNALIESGRIDEAFRSLKLAVCLLPDCAEAYFSLGNILKGWGRLDDARIANDIALCLKPDFANARLNDAICRLSRGDFAAGWPQYEWRWRGATDKLAIRDFAQPRWTGESFVGRTVLLHAEQGMGDTIQFCRYAPRVAERGGRVVMEVQGPLKRLLSGLPGVDRVVASGEGLPSFDRHCPLMSLPGIFATSMETIPALTPYLRPPDAARARWQDRLGDPADGLRVGIAWAGSPKHGNDGNRSLAFAQLAPLWTVAGIRWFSLQVGARQADLAAAPPGLIDDLSPALSDFAETAAALAELDLLVSADTAIAHLAGAIGRPAWILLPFPADWRWLGDRADSPWYPTVRLFRQARPGEWAEVLRRVAQALAGEVATRRATGAG
jgi:tetratricopeptide (TPR) repeat protein